MWNLSVEGFLESKESKKIVGKELSSGSVEKRQLLLLFSSNRFVQKNQSSQIVYTRPVPTRQQAPHICLGPSQRQLFNKRDYSMDANSAESLSALHLSFLLGCLQSIGRSSHLQFFCQKDSSEKGTNDYYSKIDHHLLDNLS